MTFLKKTGLPNLPTRIFTNFPNVVSGFAMRNSFPKNLIFILWLYFNTGLNVKLPKTKALINSYLFKGFEKFD